MNYIEKEKRTVEFYSYDTIFTYYIDKLIKSNQQCITMDDKTRKIKLEIFLCIKKDQYDSKRQTKTLSAEACEDFPRLINGS